MIYFKKRPLLFLTGILILWILLCHFAGIREQFPYPQSFDGKQVSCTGRVCQIEAGADFWYVYADHIQADFMEEVSERLKVRAILEEPADCAYGNWVQICGKLTLAEAPSNDGAFDRLFYQQTERLLFSMKNARLTVRDGRQNPLLQWMYEVRRICMRHLEQIFDEQDAGILAAMLLGDKSRLAEEIRDWYQVGGIAHVLAISGLHISLFGMALYHILRKLGISFVFSEAATQPPQTGSHNTEESTTVSVFQKSSEKKAVPEIRGTDRNINLTHHALPLPDMKLLSAKKKKKARHCRLRREQTEAAV